LSALPVIHVFPVVCKVRGWPGPHAAGTRLHQGFAGSSAQVLRSQLPRSACEGGQARPWRV